MWREAPGGGPIACTTFTDADTDALHSPRMKQQAHREHAPGRPCNTPSVHPSSMGAHPPSLLGIAIASVTPTVLPNATPVPPQTSGPSSSTHSDDAVHLSSDRAPASRRRSPARTLIQALHSGAQKMMQGRTKTADDSNALRGASGMTCNYEHDLQLRAPSGTTCNNVCEPRRGRLATTCTSLVGDDLQLRAPSGMACDHEPCRRRPATTGTTCDHERGQRSAHCMPCGAPHVFCLRG